MSVKIRLQRGGSRHKPVYRLVVADSRAKRDGRFVEVVGTYDPKNKIDARQVKVDLERTQYWIGVGAQPTDTARTLINRARREANAQGEGASASPAPKKSAATEQAKEVANRPETKAPAGTPVAGTGESGATAKAPTEASGGEA